jgi:hypothetical protein
MASMPRTPSELAAESRPQRTVPSLLTLISIATVAAALAGMAREAVTHAVAIHLASGGLASSSGVFSQVNTPTRLAGTCATLATLAVGGLAALLVRADNRFTTGWYFLWVFGSVCLMNSGRLLYSAITGTGDWSVVIATFNPPWLWRVLIGAAGIVIYRPALRFATAGLRGLIQNREVAYRDLWRLILSAYLTASILLTAGAILHPVNNGLMVIAVAAASFGLNFGLLVVPAFISEPVEFEPIAPRPMPFSWFWLIFALLAAAAFLAGVGRAISF